jgi:hypothetical protein
VAQQLLRGVNAPQCDANIFTPTLCLEIWLSLLKKNHALPLQEALIVPDMQEIPKECSISQILTASLAVFPAYLIILLI